MSSDDSRDPRAMAHLWCRACNHCMHTIGHCKRHFKRRSSYQSFGVHCACCNATYSWEELVRHLNVRHAHKRPALIDLPPSPQTGSPDQPCSSDSGPRFQPYSVSAMSRRRPPPLRTSHDPVMSQARPAPEAALGAPPASPVPPVSTARLDRRYHTGFSTTSSVSPVQQSYRQQGHAIPDSAFGYQLTLPDVPVRSQQPDTSSVSTVSLPRSTQPLQIPDASWSMVSSPMQPSLPLAAYMASMFSVDGTAAASDISTPLTLMNTEDIFLASSSPGQTLTSDVGESPVTSRASSVDTATSCASATTTSDTSTTPLRTIDATRQSALTGTTAAAASPSSSPDYISDRQLLRMAIGQLLWTFGIISTHVRNTDPNDVADSMGRHLIESQGHWLIPLTNAMNMPLTDIVALLRPIWSQLYHTRR